ncbi:transglutaminase-like cysteine peptidase [Achromobacter sp. F4_2707]|uniref:transglutaminase-like cysteine peptidase n=1 Tax=Achromobacter sp. F4_2707 TaxID=3114286 RepID=UPI0039C72733
MSVVSATRSLRQGLLAVAAGLLLVAAAAPVADALQFDPARIEQQAVSRYGQQGGQAVAQWVNMLGSLAGQPVSTQLRQVNDFWNTNARGGEDRQIWGQEDYWATPLETLGKGWADCEDYVIGKYFSLVHAGVDPNKLRMVYVRARIGGMGSSQSIAHMVLGYYETPTSEPLILDNLVGSIVPAGQRRDLQPVFSFNAHGVYVGSRASGSVERITRWQGLLSRMQQEGFRP